MQRWCPFGLKYTYYLCICFVLSVVFAASVWDGKVSELIVFDPDPI